MLYILANNDYHLHALRRHGFAELGGSAGVSLITVPHALSPIPDTDNFLAVHCFVSPLGRSNMPFILWHYRAQARAVACTLKPTSEDTLLFFTETEWLNQIIVQHFRKCGARIVMLEDGGFATYISMSLPESEPLSFREHCIQAAYRLLPDLRNSRLFKVNGVLFPRLPDSSIDLIALYRSVSLYRRVPTRCVLRPACKPCNIRRSTVVFLNGDMYYYYQTDDGYFAGLRRLLTALTKGFETVHFKFHPRESDDWKRRIHELLEREFPTINIIDRAGPIEQMVVDYRPEVLASHISAALLNIEYQGIEPLYLYHLLDDVRDQPAFAIVTRILKTWGYNFVDSDAEVHSGYHSGIVEADQATNTELRQILAPSGDHLSANIQVLSKNTSA